MTSNYEKIISCHFINNVLSTMTSLNRCHQREELENIIFHLSRMFHYIQMPEAVVEVKAEVDFIKHYFKLQSVRFGERIVFNIEELPKESIDSISIRKFSLFEKVDTIVENILEPSLSGGLICLSFVPDIQIIYECENQKEKVFYNTG